VRRDPFGGLGVDEIRQECVSRDGFGLTGGGGGGGLLRSGGGNMSEAIDGGGSMTLYGTIQDESAG